MTADQTLTPVQYGSLTSPVGTIGVVAGPAGLRRVGWQPEPPADSAAGALADRALYQLGEYFAGARVRFELELDLSGVSATARAVLLALAEVGYGETVTYGQLADRSGTGIPARAIGSVMATNPIPLVIPCHRVLSADGFGGFSGGDPGREHETKLWLLEHEGAITPPLW